GLDPAHIYVGMMRIVNSVGDGHTYVRFPKECDDFPLAVSRFGNDYRVVFASPDFAKAIGTRVVAIEGVPIDRVHELIFPLTPQDETSQYREALVPPWMTIGMLLHGLDITPESTKARFKLRDDRGAEFTVDLHSGPARPPQWAYAKSPLFREHPGEPFWYTWLPDARAIYCNWRSYKNLRENSRGLFDLAEKQHPDKLIIDLRQNAGGDYFVGLAQMVTRVRNLADINQKGHLFVLIGPFTFSAAMANAAHFRQKTAATLVGLPIGEKPNSYAEVRRVALPNSHLTLSYSVRYYKFVETGENMIRPDREIETTWEDFKSGRDPVLEWVLKQRP
ncbi:MAG TPA: S41 family peptidase, partial [Planctomycetaceae bacterium]|nr:S41 family peptidase [Planctomycetaceae bacterium]